MHGFFVYKNKVVQEETHIDEPIDIPPPGSGFKLLRLRKNGTLSPLFIGAKQIIPVGIWVRAENIPTKGFKYRPGFHICHSPHAPHLSKKNRVWCSVDMDDYKEFKRPEAQGGLWYLARWMRIRAICSSSY